MKNILFWPILEETIPPSNWFRQNQAGDLCLSICIILYVANVNRQYYSLLLFD